ncbi:MAG: nitronate monooxygenase, partial [Spirochaetia bacterium]|nr:nitronate monooxygenase [Spirochaetia bacterium]
NIMLMSPHVAEVAQVVADLKVPVVTTGAGNPAKYMPMWLEAGIKVIPVIPSVMLAKRMEKLGAVAVVAEGGESGGHIGELNTMALVPQVVDALSIPVIAAGGIGDGRGIAAAFMLGAKGVQMGTRFLVANECGVHPNYKAKVLKASDIDTIVTGRKLGHPVRSLKTSFSRNFFMKENDPSISNEELESAGIGALRAAAVDGDDTKGCFIAGQIAGLVNKEQSAKEIVDELVAQAEELLKGTKWVK